MISVHIPIKLLNTLDNERSKEIGLQEMHRSYKHYRKKLEDVGQL
jgi:hypothetical protein